MIRTPYRMETTPKSKIPSKRFKNKQGTSKPSNAAETDDRCSPTHTLLRSSTTMEKESDSPIYFPATQDSSEDVDVLWDWNSPQRPTGDKIRRKQKRFLIPTQSPKFPITRHSSMTQPQNFDKLRDELRALQEQLALPDDESVLFVSPQQESEFKEASQAGHEEHDFEVEEDMFNDSFDQQLLLCTQQAETKMFENVNAPKERPRTPVRIHPVVLFDNSEIDKVIDKYNRKNDLLADDSFDLLLGGLDVECKTPKPFQTSIINNQDSNTTCTLSKSKLEEIERKRLEAVAKKRAREKLPNTTTSTNWCTIPKSKNSIQRTVSEDQTNTNRDKNFIETASGKLEFHRTKSFELDAIKQPNILSHQMLEEIEKKRREAQVRLGQKRPAETAVSNNTVIISPTKCTFAEIERKRKQALAKLEAKKLQEAVEKKRLEALKRLQNNRMKNAGHVKGTLAKRL